MIASLKLSEHLHNCSASQMLPKIPTTSIYITLSYSRMRSIKIKISEIKRSAGDLFKLLQIFCATADFAKDECSNK